jgi:cytochrome c oxidase subunit 2
MKTAGATKGRAVSAALARGTAPRFASLIPFALLVSACEGEQSVLAPAGRDAQTLSMLFWVMAAGAVVIWVLINGVFVYAYRVNRERMSTRSAEAIIIGGGVIFPSVVLAVLLAYALSIMPDLRAQGTGTRIEVTGEEWWWRVRYWPEGAETPIESANEVVLPAGTRSEITLRADDYIHSFWIPVLGGKTDMIPGRETRMSLEPVEPGLYRGQCTEFCGESHALMAFSVRVLAPEDYARWLAARARPAAPPEDDAAARGREVFFAEGCGACHTVRGTLAAGQLGPDLTHLGSRATLASGTLPMTAEAAARWVRAPEAIKPGAEMPPYDHLSEDALAALGADLVGLE